MTAAAVGCAMIVATWAAAPTHATDTDGDLPTPLQWTVVERYPHDKTAFTQGLVLRDQTLYESTGLRGHSSVRIVDLATGTVRKQVDLPTKLFGEGLALVGDRLFQLTWTNGVARVYSTPALDLITEYRYDGQGWGLCFDGRNLVMSDGSHRLYVRDPETFQVTSTIEVSEQGRPVTRLNELECVGRHIYANVWGTWRIVRIDRDSGRVDATLDASNLLSVMEKQALVPEAVMNGIAYDDATDTLLLTGKMWPRIHRIRLRTQKSK